MPVEDWCHPSFWHLLKILVIAPLDCVVRIQLCLITCVLLCNSYTISRNNKAMTEQLFIFCVCFQD